MCEKLFLGKKLNQHATESLLTFSLQETGRQALSGVLFFLWVQQGSSLKNKRYLFCSTVPFKSAYARYESSVLSLTENLFDGPQ